MRFTLLTGAAVSAAAVLLAVWVNQQAQPGKSPVPATAVDAAQIEDTEFVSPVKDGVWPSAVISEQMQEALEKRAETAAGNAGGMRPLPDGNEQGVDSSPRDIGEFLDPDAPQLGSAGAAPRSIGDFLDPDAAQLDSGAGERIALGEFLDPETPSEAAATGEQPVSIGRYIDPDAGSRPPGHQATQRIDIGEYLPVESP